MNWNNKPAPGFAAADDNFAYGSIHRSLLLQRGIRSPARTRSSTSCTDDEQVGDAGSARGRRSGRSIDDGARAHSGADARGQQLRRLVTAWLHGGRVAARPERRRQGRRPGRGDPRRGVGPSSPTRVLAPVLGPLTDRLAALMGRDDAPGPSGSAVHRRLVRLRRQGSDGGARREAEGSTRTATAAAATRQPARSGLWAALDAAGNELAAAQGADPTAWRSDATAERIQFAPGILPATMRWTNRPTYQQILSFDGHR